MPLRLCGESIISFLQARQPKEALQPPVQPGKGLPPICEPVLGFCLSTMSAPIAVSCTNCGGFIPTRWNQTPLFQLAPCSSPGRTKQQGLQMVQPLWMEAGPAPDQTQLSHSKALPRTCCESWERGHRHFTDMPLTL